MTLIFCIPCHKSWGKLVGRQRGHFMTLIEVNTHLIECYRGRICIFLFPIGPYFTRNLNWPRRHEEKNEKSPLNDHENIVDKSFLATQTCVEQTLWTIWRGETASCHCHDFHGARGSLTLPLGTRHWVQYSHSFIMLHTKDFLAL